MNKLGYVLNVPVYRREDGAVFVGAAPNGRGVCLTVASESPIEFCTKLLQLLGYSYVLSPACAPAPEPKRSKVHVYHKRGAVTTYEAEYHDTTDGVLYLFNGTPDSDEEEMVALIPAGQWTRVEAVK
jgi:hypothetical protein